MRYIFLTLLVPFCSTLLAKKSLAADYLPHSGSNLALQSKAKETFYTQSSSLIQQQINLIARIEDAIAHSDANRVRAVRGQLTVHTKTVSLFLKRQQPNPKAFCERLVVGSNTTEPQAKIYCSLYTSSHELLKLTPILDRLLARRGELALVRELPIVTGERFVDPVLSIAPFQHPDLGNRATPFAIREPWRSTNEPTVIGGAAKTAIADYVSPMQPAILQAEDALRILQSSQKMLTFAKTVFPPGIEFQQPQETAAALDRFRHDIDPQERSTYAKFLQQANTGIFRVLPAEAYLRPLNTVQNRLFPSVTERYPFPNLGETRGQLTPKLAIHLVGDRFQLITPGIDYGFIVDVGDIALEKLDSKLKAVTSDRGQFFLTYQPPQQFSALQSDRRKFVNGKDQNWNLTRLMLTEEKAKLNHTYLVRSLQFQLPEPLIAGKPIDRRDRINLDRILSMPSSDTIIAFRPVRQRPDGSYTILWRVIKQLPDPKIQDLEAYVKLE